MIFAVALDEKGSDLEPNTLTQVAFQKSTVTRLPAPYKANCYDGWEVAGYPEIKKHIPALPYSISVSSLFSVNFLKSIISSKHNEIVAAMSAPLHTIKNHPILQLFSSSILGFSLAS